PTTEVSWTGKLRFAITAWLLHASLFAAGFPLGIDYSAKLGLERNGNPAVTMVCGADGALYLLGYGLTSRESATAVLGEQDPSNTYVMKLAPGGERIVYVTILGFRPKKLGVDGSGNVYMTDGFDPAVIYKLNASGTAFVYEFAA